MNAKKFFIENINRLSPQANPHEWNTQNGLLALARQLEEIERQQTNQSRQIQQLEQAIRRIAPR